MELFYLGCAFACTIICLYHYALPKISTYIQAEIFNMKQQLDTLEHSLIQVKQNLYKTQLKYEHLNVELQKKHASLPKTLQMHANDMQQDLDQKINQFKDQMQKTHIEALKQQQTQEVKTYVLNAIHDKLIEKLKDKNIRHPQVLQQIVLECKKSFQ